jgi:hypothetical protein
MLPRYSKMEEMVKTEKLNGRFSYLQSRSVKPGSDMHRRKQLHFPD